jgi:hypothetical protein
MLALHGLHQPVPIAILNTVDILQEVSLPTSISLHAKGQLLLISFDLKNFSCGAGRSMTRPSTQNLIDLARRA